MSFDPTRLSTFTATEVSERRVDGVLRVGKPEVKDNWIVDVITLDRHLVTARLRLPENGQENVERKGSLLHLPDRDLSVDLTEIEIGKTYVLLDSWWGERAELVLDRSKVWTHEVFHPSDAVKTQFDDGRKEVVPGGWDHEHCKICMQTISERAEPEGYRNQNNGWVCVSCYEAFVEPRSLAFLVKWDKQEG